MFREAHPCHGFKQLHVADAVKCICIVYEYDEGQLVHFQSFFDKALQNAEHVRCSSVLPETCLFFREFFFSLVLQSVQNNS